MISFDRSLLAYVERVLLSRDITPDYAAKVRYCHRKFCEWLGCDPGIDGLDAQPVNEFLRHLQEQGLRPDTVAGYRRAILVVWNSAFSDGDVQTPPLRIRKIKTSRQIIEAFNHDELNVLLRHVRMLTDYFPNGVERATFWTATLHSAYSTGLRRGDLLRVKRDQIGQDGTARILQNKTQYPITVRFSTPALAAICSMKVDARALPWPFHQNALSRQFRKLVAASGIRKGQFRWLRRSAGSYSEAECAGNGQKILGHRSESVFRRFYNDESISGAAPISPPPLQTLVALWLTLGQWLAFV